MIRPSSGQPCSHSVVALEIRWLCSEAPSTLVVRKVRPFAGSRNSSAAMAVASAASTLRPVNRSSPTPQTPQSRAPRWPPGVDWIVPQCLQPRTWDALKKTFQAGAVPGAARCACG